MKNPNLYFANAVNVLDQNSLRLVTETGSVYSRGVCALGDSEN